MLSGRSIYIIDLHRIVADLGTSEFVKRCESSHMSSIWIRIGRGEVMDPNLSVKNLSDINSLLQERGIELWGWHVPFCKNSAKAKVEASAVVDWVQKFNLSGVLLDAERTNNPHRFQGTSIEAHVYVEQIKSGLATIKKSVAFSSHDRPSLHKDLPFDKFISEIYDICPQVYYRYPNVKDRLDASIKDYSEFEEFGDLISRYKPTGNITISGDVSVGNARQCVSAAAEFISEVKGRKLSAYSFWSWDDAPEEIWPFFSSIPE